MRQLITTLTIAWFVPSLLIAQAGPFTRGDVAYAGSICTDSVFVLGATEESNVIDLTIDNRGCLLAGERQGIWLAFKAATAGRIGLAIAPLEAGDYDFGLWGPFESAPDSLVTTPVRCSWGALSGPTGLNFAATDLSETAGGDSWVKALDVLEDELYILYVDNFSFNGVGFSLTWEFQDGASLACGNTPVAEFGASESVIQPGATVSFTDLSTEDPYAWYWEFQGATPATSLEQDPQNVLYAELGCYDVSLTAYNALGENTLSATCQVLVALSTNIAATSQEHYRIVQQDGMVSIVPEHGVNYTLVVQDALGRTLRSTSAQGPIQLAAQDLPRGLVLFTMLQDGARHVQRIVMP